MVLYSCVFREGGGGQWYYIAVSSGRGEGVSGTIIIVVSSGRGSVVLYSCVFREGAGGQWYIVVSSGRGTVVYSCVFREREGEGRRVSDIWKGERIVGQRSKLYANSGSWLN